MQYLNNSWVIGIGGGVLSGLLVSFVSRLIFSRKDNKEYHQKIITANQEILYAIRPSISEVQILAKEIIESIKSATAKKYNIEAQDLYKIEEILDIIIKEVMDSSFISIETKINYCNKLTSLKSKDVIPAEIPEGKYVQVSQKKETYYEYRQKLLAMMSTSIGMMTAVMTMIVYFFVSKKEYSLTLSPEKILPLLVIMTAGVMTVFTSALFLNIKRKYKEEKKEKKEEKQDK